MRRARRSFRGSVPPLFARCDFERPWLRSFTFAAQPRIALASSHPFSRGISDDAWLRSNTFERSAIGRSESKMGSQRDCRPRLFGFIRLPRSRLDAAATLFGFNRAKKLQLTLLSQRGTGRQRRRGDVAKTLSVLENGRSGCELSHQSQDERFAILSLGSADGPAAVRGFVPSDDAQLPTWLLKRPRRWFEKTYSLVKEHGRSSRLHTYCWRRAFRCRSAQRSALCPIIEKSRLFRHLSRAAPFTSLPQACTFFPLWERSSGMAKPRRRRKVGSKKRKARRDRRKR